MTTQLLMVNRDQTLLEVDHLQIYTGGVLNLFALQGLGLNNANQIVRREAQGTVSMLFFFENAYLEVISIEDEIAFRNYSTQTRMNLLERSQWRQTGASPFGVGLRPKVSNRFHSEFTMDDSKFSTESGYQETKINFSAENLVAIAEPMCFTIPHHIALTNWLDNSNKDHQQLITHPLGVKRLTSVKIKINTHLNLTNAVSLLEDNGIITIERGMSPLLELTFDGNAKNKVVDARPILPIQLKY